VGISIFSEAFDRKWNQPLYGIDVVTAKASDGVVFNEGNPFDRDLVVSDIETEDSIAHFNNYNN
jgi:hypothetical protein